MDAKAVEVREAYSVLIRNRSELLAQRDEINGRLAQVEAAVEALRAILGEEGAPASTTSDEPGGPDAADSTSESLSTSAARAGTAKAAGAKNGRPTSRKARVREIMLESAEEWLNVKDISGRIEGREATESERTATYEMLRRMAVQGELERDNTSRPTRFRGKTTVLRERLLGGAG